MLLITYFHNFNDDGFILNSMLKFGDFYEFYVFYIIFRSTNPKLFYFFLQIIEKYMKIMHPCMSVIQVF